MTNLLERPDMALTETYIWAFRLAVEYGCFGGMWIAI